MAWLRIRADLRADPSSKIWSDVSIYDAIASRLSGSLYGLQTGPVTLRIQRCDRIDGKIRCTDIKDAKERYPLDLQTRSYKR